MMLPYAVSTTVRGLLREKWINLISVLTIASGLLIISIALLFFYNVHAATRKLPEKLSVVLYLDDNVPKERLETIISTLRRNSALSSVRYIPKAQALKELESGLKDSSFVLEGLDQNPLPDALELKLNGNSITPLKVKRLAEDASKIKGIKEVDYGEKFVSTLDSLTAGLKTAGMVLIAALAIGIIFVCYSTVKILFYRRVDEIETFKLLGATKGFIRTPFLIEGAVIGCGGGLTALAALLGVYYLILLKLSLVMPVFSGILFPVQFTLSLPLIGIFLGISGAAVALGRLKY